MITHFFSKSLQNAILLLCLEVSLFFLLVFSPLLYYSFSPRFYVNDVSPVSVQSLVYVQNVYGFIQGTSVLDPVFTVAERSHLEDVKQIFRRIVIVDEVMFVIFLLVLLFLSLQQQKSIISTGLLRGSLAASFFYVALLLALNIDFQAVFRIFHILFFPQGNWSFDSSSVLIILFPATFFEIMAIRIFLTSLLLSFVVFIVGLLIKRYPSK